MPTLASRMERLGTESAFEVLARARALEATGRRIVHLEIGEPDFDTALHIKTAAGDALDRGFTHYTPSAGLPEIRRAIAAYVARTRGVDVEPERVIVTPGAKPVIFYSVVAVAGDGDEVLVPNPGFPIYESAVRLAGAVPVPVPLLERTQFRVDPAALERLITPRTRLLILNSPHNPTGASLTAGDVTAIADLARRHDLWVLSDEIYSRLLYAGEHYSLLTPPDMAERTVLLDGFSKTYAMTGWRLGYAVVPATLAETFARLQTNLTSCTTAFVQMAGVAALEGPQTSVEAMLAAFARRRQLVVERLNRIDGVHCLAPDGAFYTFPRVDVPGMTSAEVAAGLLEEEGVALLAGTAFGQYGEGYLRLSFATSEDELEEGIDRLRHGLARLRR